MPMVPPVILEDIARADGRYSAEAYAFVLEALDYERKHLGRSGRPSVVKVFRVSRARGHPRRRRHLTGQELAEGLRKLALERFGMLARSVLESWGITSTEDFGEIVYVLIRHRVLRKNRQDRKSDFKNVYGFAQAFGEGYRICGPGDEVSF